MSRLAVRLFGAFQVELEGSQATGFESGKTRALLAYLMVEADRPHRREALAALLWPERSERSARTNLRRALAVLRKAIRDQEAQPGHLKISRQTLQFNQDSDYWLDIHAIRHLPPVAEGSPIGSSIGSPIGSPDIAVLEAAVADYRGPFLEGFAVADSAAFEEWLMLTRDELGRRVYEALARLAQSYEAAGRLNEALAQANRLIELEPWDERGHRQVMRLLAASGRRHEALAHFGSLQQTLAEELNVEPDSATVTLRDHIRAGELTPREAPPFPGRTGPGQIRGFELRERLGSGGFGIVYRAYQPAVRRDVAIKIIHPDYANRPNFIRRFEGEAQLVARLEHPHIVPLYDYWREPAGAFLVMRWLQGGSLEQALARGPWKIARVAAALEQIGGALGLAHQHGVVHRDIKPANILLDNAGNAYLSDFGIAALADSAYLPDLEAASTGVSDLSGSPECLSPEQVLGKPATPGMDIYSLGVVLYQLLTGEHPFPATAPDQLAQKHLRQPLPSLLDSNPGLPAAVDDVIQMATAKDPVLRYPNVLALVRDFRGAAIADAGQRERGVVPGRAGTSPEAASVAGSKQLANPYKGLRPFSEADAANFFGRRALVERLLERMTPVADWDNGERGRFLAVVGPSGCGKSSVIQAGLIPAIHDGALPGSQDWFVARMTPDAQPFVALHAALLRVATYAPADLLQRLQEDERGLARMLPHMLPLSLEEGDDSRLILFVDQFEELFTLVKDEAVRASFIHSLYRAICDGRGRMRLIIGLRADFYDRPLQYEGLGELIREHTEVVLPLSPEEVEEAVTAPARRAGLQLEDGLVARILADVREEPGSLPLLQYAMTELFDCRQEGVLTQAAYQEIGGVGGAVGRRAEGLFDALDEGRREVARQMFLRLVAPGADAEDTRRRMLRADLVQLRSPGRESDPDLAEQVLEHFGRYRLLTFDRDSATRAPTVEIAHEALLQEWSRLHDWIAESRGDLEQHQRLAAAAGEWLEANREDSYLLRGTRLKSAALWLATTDLAVSTEERAYVEAGQEAEEAEEAEERDRQAQERALKRRSRLLLGSLLVAVPLVMCISFLIAGSLGLFSLITSQFGPTATPDGRQVTAWEQGRGVQFRPGADAGGAEIAASGNDNSPTVRDARTGEILFTLQGHVDQVLNLAYSGNGERLATASLDGTIRVWDANSGELIRTIGSSLGELTSPALNPDGSLVAATSVAGAVAVWDVASGERVQFYHARGPTLGIAFSPDGTLLAAGSDSSDIYLWELGEGLHLRLLEAHNGAVSDVAFSPDGKTLASSSLDRTVRLWDLATEESVAIIRNNRAVVGVDYGPDGRFIVAGMDDGTVRVYAVATADEVLRYSMDNGTVLNVSFSPDGALLAAGNDIDRTVIWRVDLPGE